MRRRARSSRPVTAKSGFTLIEVVVAMLVTTVGVLALGATAALVERLAGEGAAQTRAASIAQSRFELFRGTRCAALGAGASTHNGISESWSAASVAGRVWLVTDSVVFLSGRHATQVYRSLVRC